VGIDLVQCNTPVSEDEKQKLEEKVARSRLAWQKLLQSHDDMLTV